MLNNKIPTLDLHGEVSPMVDLLVKDFILENYISGHKKVIIIHGVGTGAIRKAVHQSLNNNKLVSNFKIDMFNAGSTIIEIKD
jgi:DNA mismatch repair protein MutS2